MFDNIRKSISNFWASVRTNVNYSSSYLRASISAPFYYYRLTNLLKNNVVNNNELAALMRNPSLPIVASWFGNNLIKIFLSKKEDFSFKWLYISNLLDFSKNVIGSAVDESNLINDALENNQSEILEKLKDNPVVVDYLIARSNKVLKIASSDKQITVLKVLLSMPKFVNAIKASLLNNFHIACDKGDFKVAAELSNLPFVDDGHTMLKMLIESFSQNKWSRVSGLLSIPKIQELIIAKNPYLFNQIVASGTRDVIKQLFNMPILKQTEFDVLKTLDYALINNDMTSLKSLLQTRFVQKQLKKSRNPNAIIDLFMKALTIGNFDAVKLFLGLEVFKNDIPLKGKEVFIFARSGHHEFLLKELLLMPNIIENLKLEDLGCYDAFGLNAGLVKILITNDELKKIIFNDQEILNSIVETDNLELFKEFFNQDVLQQIGEKNHDLLQAAASSSRGKIAAFLLTHSEFQKYAAANDNEALINACEANNVKLVQVLLAIPEVLENVTASENMAFRHACAHPDGILASLLLAIPNVKAEAAAGSNEALQNASRANNIDLVKLLLKDKLVLDDISANGNQALYDSIGRADSELSKYLLSFTEVKREASANSNAALLKAIKYEQWDLAYELLSIESVRRNITVNGNAIMKLACKSGNVELCKLILELPENIKSNTVAYDALWTAYLAKDTKLVESLMEFPVVRQQAANNNILLHLACDRNDWDFIKKLIEIPELVQEIGHNDQTHLLNGNWYQDYNAEHLKSKRAELGASAEDNFVLQALCQSGQIASVKVLLENPQLREKLSSNKQMVFNLLRQSDDPNMLDMILKSNIIPVSDWSYHLKQLTSAGKNELAHNLRICIAMATFTDKKFAKDFGLAIGEEQFQKFQKFLAKNFQSLDQIYPIRKEEKLYKVITDEIILMANEGPKSLLYLVEKCKDTNVEKAIKNIAAANNSPKPIDPNDISLETKSGPRL